MKKKKEQRKLGAKLKEKWKNTRYKRYEQKHGK